VRPTLVATATKFGLGAEIQSLTGLLTIIVTTAKRYCDHASLLVVQFVRSLLNRFLVNGAFYTAKFTTEC